jgi:hypothetical protein
LQDFLVIPWGHVAVVKKGLNLSMKERYGKISYSPILFVRQVDVPSLQMAIETDYFCITACKYHLQGLLLYATKSVKNYFHNHYQNTV